jgi:hypothetical protein
MRTPWAFAKHWLFEEPQELTDDEKKRVGTIAGLRELAALLEKHPEAQLPSSYSVSVWHTIYDADHDAAVEHLRGLSKKFGGMWKKEPSGETFYLIRSLGGVLEYRLGAPREAVCAKRVVGRHTVMRPSPRYSPPPMEPVVEDVVEWDCPEVIR